MTNFFDKFNSRLLLIKLGKLFSKLFLSSIKQHSPVCQYIKVNCRKSVLCDEMLLRKDMMEHEKSCGYQHLNCQWCDEVHKKNQLEIEDHLATECDFQEVECQFFSNGCPDKVKTTTWSSALLFSCNGFCIKGNDKIMI
uniref:TRAF-type domain-containing protein n=1 Tax=Clytia hemisphaerica TaxID=252671 RepID=A0A7M6DPT8_9CNID